MRKRLNQDFQDSRINRICVAAILAVAITLTFTACGKGGGDVKLLEYITDDYGDVIERFEYDKQSRLVKRIEYRFLDEDRKISDSSTIAVTYSGDLVTVETSYDTTKYVKKGNTITVENKRNPGTLTIDKDGYIQEGNCPYQYQDGSLNIECNNEPYTRYKFDDKKSPFSNSNTPKWLIQDEFSRNGYGAKNNILAINTEDSPGGLELYQNYEYEYNSEGFATKQTLTDGFEGGDYGMPTMIKHFVYSGRTAEEIAAFDAARLAAKKEMLADRAKATAEKEAEIAKEKAAEKAAYEYAKAKKDKALKEGQTFTDKRDGKIYRIVKIGEQTWMAENLNYDAEGFGNMCYAYACDGCGGSGGECLLGKLYGLEDALKACPSGFHLPAKDEWEALIAFVQSDKGCKDCAGKHLKAAGGWNKVDGKSGNGTDSYGFSALPGGECSYGEFGDLFCNGIGDHSYWWSDTKSFEMYGGNEVISSDSWRSSQWYSVRCIKDEDKTPDTEL